MSGQLKYTLSDRRKHWVKRTHPGLLNLVKLLKKIPFEDYSYEGSCLVSFDRVNENKIRFMDEDNKTHQPDVVQSINIKIKPSKEKPYLLLGGICYNILHDQYKSTNINNFLDDTGDIDVRIYYHSSIEIQKTTEIEQFLKSYDHKNEEEEEEKNISTFINCVSRTDEVLNPYIKHYAHWLLDHIQTYVTEDRLQKLFPNCKPIYASDIQTYLKKNSEPQYLTEEKGYKEININDFGYLLCFTDDTSLRIQLILNSGMTIDHALEFIFLLPSTNNLNSIFSLNDEDFYQPHTINTKNMFNVNGYQIQTVSNLIMSNIQAYTERVHLIDNPESSHKAINHMARMIYLFVLVKRNSKDKSLRIDSIIIAIRDWLKDVVKEEKKIIFYRIDKKGTYKKNNIEIGVLLTAFQSILKPKYFMENSDIYSQIKIGSEHEKEAFRKLMTLVNGNRFYKQKSASSNSSSRKNTASRKKRAPLRSQSTIRKTKKHTQSI